MHRETIQQGLKWSSDEVKACPMTDSHGRKVELFTNLQVCNTFSKNNLHGVFLSPYLLQCVPLAVIASVIQTHLKSSSTYSKKCIC